MGFLKFKTKNGKFQPSPGANVGRNDLWVFYSGKVSCRKPLKPSSYVYTTV